MKKLVIFDAMGVIYKTSDDVKDLLYPYLTSLDASISYDVVKNLYIELSFGNITSIDFFSKLGFSAKYPKIEIDYLDSCLELDAGFIPLASKLKEKYNMAMLSNDVSKWSKYLRQKYDLDRYFIDSVISGDVRCRKPSTKIYEIALDSLNYNAQDCVFIDDSITNLKAAKSIGMKTIWFNRNNESTAYDSISVKSMSELRDAIDSSF